MPRGTRWTLATALALALPWPASSAPASPSPSSSEAMIVDTAAGAVQSLRREPRPSLDEAGEIETHLENVVAFLSRAARFLEMALR